MDILAAKGTHSSQKSHNDVVAIKADHSKFSYFPHGLKKVFKKLKLIWIENCQMKEIHQSDMMLYPDLEILCIGGNDIQVLEEDLFKYNRDLRVFSCWYCNIMHVDPKVFDHLTKLSDIWLVVNQCIDTKTDGISLSVSDVIGKIKDKCISPSFLSLKEKFKDFEEESKNLSNERFNQKLQALEKELKTSKFFNFPSLKKKIEEFKNQNIQNLCKVEKIIAEDSKSEEITALNMKINDIENDLKTLISDGFGQVENMIKNLKNSHIDELRELTDKVEELRAENANTLRKVDQYCSLVNRFDTFSEKLEKLDERVGKCKEV